MPSPTGAGIPEHPAEGNAERLGDSQGHHQRRRVPAHSATDFWVELLNHNRRSCRRPTPASREAPPQVTVASQKSCERRNLSSALRPGKKAAPLGYRKHPIARQVRPFCDRFVHSPDVSNRVSAFSMLHHLTATDANPRARCPASPGSPASRLPVSLRAA